MASSKTILKKAFRRRGTVSLTKVRQAIDIVLAQKNAAQVGASSSHVGKPR